MDFPSNRSEFALMFYQMETVGSIDDVPCRYLPGRDIRVFAQARLTQSEDVRLDYIYINLLALFDFRAKLNYFKEMRAALDDKSSH